MTQRSTLELEETETLTEETPSARERRRVRPERPSPDDTLAMDAPASFPAGEETLARRRRLRRPLPLWVRVVVLLVGWVVLLVGVAGLVLPGIQGVLTIILGAAILSVASETAHRWTRQCLQRWPKAWNRVEAFREKIHDKLHRMVHKD